MIKNKKVEEEEKEAAAAAWSKWFWCYASWYGITDNLPRQLCTDGL